MKQMVDCSLFCFIAAALLGSMVYFLFTANKNNKISQFLSRLTKEQQEVYRNITEERLNIYLMGFCIGLIVGIIYLITYANKKQPVYCIFIAIVLGFAYLHYTIMPKSDYMLNHIDTKEQAQAWLEVYKAMKKKCYTGMILGVLALPFICAAFN